MKGRTKKLLIGLLLVLIPLWVLGDPPVYFAKEIRGQVVDEATGQPLEGVVIVAEWRLYAEGIGSGGHGGTLNTLEAVTDKDGRYHIPGWGPRPRPPFAYLDHLDPELKFFRSEYYPRQLTNEILGGANRNRSSVRTSEWDGKLIKLKPFDGEWLSYANRIDSMWAPVAGHCLRECPRLVLALDAEDKRIKALAPKTPVIPTIVNIEHLRSSDRDFLRAYQIDEQRK